MSQRDPEDGPSVLERLSDRLGGDDSKTTRVQDEPCDGCGTEEGSKVTSKEDGWVLCRSCFNDPDVWEEVVNA